MPTRAQLPEDKFEEYIEIRDETKEARSETKLDSKNFTPNQKMQNQS